MNSSQHLQYGITLCDIMTGHVTTNLFVTLNMKLIETRRKISNLERISRNCQSYAHLVSFFLFPFFSSFCWQVQHQSRWKLYRGTSNSLSHGVAYTLVNNTNEKTPKYLIGHETGSRVITLPITSPHGWISCFIVKSWEMSSQCSMCY